MAAAEPRRTRRLAVIVLLVVAATGAIAAAVPSLISSEIVKKRISDQITHWTGRTFTFTGDAELQLFPYLTVVLQDVRIADPPGMGAGEDPFISAGVMIGKLELLPLFLGRLQFVEFRLVNPTIDLEVGRDGRPNWVFDQGVVGTLAAKGDSELSPDDPLPPSPRAEVNLGRFLIRGGSVRYHDARNGIDEQLENVNVNLSWQTTETAASGRGNFTWRGQRVSFGGEIGTPLVLLAGGDSPLQVSVEAEPATFAFEGAARQFDGLQLEGAASLDLPSVSAFAAWMGAPEGGMPLVNALSVAGSLSWVDGTVNIADASVSIDGNAGEGALTAAKTAEGMSVQGTLDFAGFDFSSQIAALDAAIADGDAWRSQPIDMPLLARGDLDFRLSAGRATAAGYEIGPLAAGLIVRDGVMLVEIGEAHLGAATIDASLRAEVVDGVLTGGAVVGATDIAASTVSGVLGLSGVTGTGEISADLKASGATWGAFIASLHGTGMVALDEGSVAGIDVARLPALVADPGAPPIGGSTAYGRLTSTFSLAEGVLSTGDLQAEGPGYRIGFAGKLALANEAIDGRGVLTLPGEPPREVPFLVNGTLPSPAFHPDLGGTLPRPLPGGGVPVPGNNG